MIVKMISFKAFVLTGCGYLCLAEKPSPTGKIAKRMTTNEVAKISKALADPTRLQIYESIAAQPEMYCGEIIERYGLAPGTVSHHLKTLVEAGLIECRREGQFVYNRALPETMREYTQALSRMSHSSGKQEHQR
jgi:ArsR family transcriptional regulator, arsenate/arsenite/antimonite-responsive transcriptional repressor